MARTRTCRRACGPCPAGFDSIATSLGTGRLASMRSRDAVLRHWAEGKTHRVSSGFYKSQALQWLAPEQRA